MRPTILPPDLPTLSDISPAYAEMTAKAGDITKELSKLGEELQSLVVAARESKDGRYGDGVEVEPTAQDARVAKIIGDTVPEVTAKVTFAEARRKIEARRADLQAAANILNQRIAVERMKASRVIIDRIEPRYREIMVDVVSKMIDALEAAAQYRQFAIELNQLDIGWSQINPMGVGIGGVVQRGSPIGLWLMEACRRGFGDLARVQELQR
jgi:hypothetical protein